MPTKIHALNREKNESLSRFGFVVAIVIKCVECRVDSCSFALALYEKYIRNENKTVKKKRRPNTILLVYINYIMAVRLGSKNYFSLLFAKKNYRWRRMQCTHTQTHHFRVEGTGQTKHLIYIFDLVEIKNTHHTQTHIRSAAVEMKTNATHATRSFVLIKKRAHSQNNILHDIRESMSDEYHLETTKTKGKPKKKKKIEMQYVLICGSKRRWREHAHTRNERKSHGINNKNIIYLRIVNKLPHFVQSHPDRE